MTVPGLDFVAVDFETANGKRESACAVGVAVVRGGKVTASESWLIRPPSSAAWFNQRNTAVHGITPDGCAARGVPWPETAQRLERLCAGLPVVAHNASFDRSVWESANRATGVDTPVPSFHCTLRLSRGHLDLVDHELPTVARHLGLDDFPHHRAEADAVAAAQVTVELAERTGASTVEELWDRAPRRSATGSAADDPALPPVADKAAAAPAKARVEPCEGPRGAAASDPSWNNPAAPPSRDRRPWDPPAGHAPLAARPRQPWDPPPPPPAPAAGPQRRWKFHAVMWSVIAFLTVGMFLVGLVMSLTGVPESVWAAVVGVSWLIAPLVVLAWLIMTVVRAVRSRRRSRSGPWG